MKRLAIIPARGGSKRIPRKNIKNFLGKPIIAYSIEAAIASNLFDEIMVSTDDAEIAAVARESGAKVPFMRSDKNADDFATTSDVIQEVLRQYADNKYSYDSVCCIYPTAPFITAERLKQGSELLDKGSFGAVVPLVKFSFPIQRAVRLSSNGKVSFFQPEYIKSRSQDLEPAYHDAGQFYWFNVDAFEINQSIWTSNTGAIILNETEVQDIDTPEDWKIAEFKFKINNGH
jgi:N-acylneuraminate cytidylyltransferase